MDAEGDGSMGHVGALSYGPMVATNLGVRGVWLNYWALSFEGLWFRAESFFLGGWVCCCFF